MRIILKTGLPILIAVTFVFLPFLANSNLLLNRNNDLTEFFWPLFYYLKENILVFHQIPATNEMWFAGTPLLADPQNPFWYIPNFIFLTLPIDTAIVVSLYLHSILGTIGMYLVSRKIFAFSKRTSLLTAFLFILSPIFFSYLEAGHWGLAIAWNWLPYFFLSGYQLATSPNKKVILLFVISASSLYFNHILTATIAAIPIGLFWIYKKRISYPLSACILSVIAISPALYFQLSWQGETTRNLLILGPETFPIWRGKMDFIKSLFVFNPETEKAITFGTIPSILAFVGFLKLKARAKIFFLLLFIIVAGVVLNNVSPLISLLVKLKPYILMRVSTRIWLIAFFPLLYLFGKGINNLPKSLALILGALAIVNSTLIGYSYLAKPISERDSVPESIYQILADDKSNFRTFCLTRCIPQKEAAIRSIRLVEGYGTLQSKDYFETMQQALGSIWNKYTLSVPPFEVYLYQTPQPNVEVLAGMGTKYVISKYTLTDPNLFEVYTSNGYTIYKNKLFDPNIK